MSKVFWGKEAFNSEVEIIDTLKKPIDNARYIKEIPILLISEIYDVKNLVKLAKEYGQQNRLGYLTDLALVLLERHEGKLENEIDNRIDGVRQNLRYIEEEMSSHKKEAKTPLYENMSNHEHWYTDRHPKNIEICKKLEGKWNMVGGFGIEEMYDYMRFIMKEPRKTVLQLPIEELVH